MVPMRTTPVAATSASEMRRDLAALAEQDSAPRLDLLHRLAWEVRNVDATESHTLANVAVALARSLGDERAEAFALVARAYSSVRLSRGSEGIVDAERAVAMFREFGDPVGLPRALNTLGISYGDASRFMDALEVFLGLLTTCEESGDQIGQADALNDVGIVYVNLDDHSAPLGGHAHVRATE
jgi:hypothetical protein